MRKLIAVAILPALGACQTTAPTERMEISGTMGRSGDCGFLRSTDGTLFDVYVAEYTRFERRDGLERFTFPDGSVAEDGKPYRFLVEMGKNKPICYETAVTINGVLP